MNILVTSNTIKLAPFDWALNLVLFQICVRDSYLLRGIQNVNFNVWEVPLCDRDRNAVKYTKNLHMIAELVQNKGTVIMSYFSESLLFVLM